MRRKVTKALSILLWSIPLSISLLLTIGNAVIPSFGGTQVVPVDAAIGAYIMIASFFLIPLGIATGIIKVH